MSHKQLSLVPALPRAKPGAQGWWEMGEAVCGEGVPQSIA